MSAPLTLGDIDRVIRHGSAFKRTSDFNIRKVKDAYNALVSSADYARQHGFSYTFLRTLEVHNYVTSSKVRISKESIDYLKSGLITSLSDESIVSVIKSIAAGKFNTDMIVTMERAHNSTLVIPIVFSIEDSIIFYYNSHFHGKIKYDGLDLGRFIYGMFVCKNTVNHEDFHDAIRYL